jgi:hypothetical protein
VTNRQKGSVKCRKSSTVVEASVDCSTTCASAASRVSSSNDFHSSTSQRGSNSVMFGKSSALNQRNPRMRDPSISRDRIEVCMRKYGGGITYA